MFDRSSFFFFFFFITPLKEIFYENILMFLLVGVTFLSRFYEYNKDFVIIADSKASDKFNLYKAVF